MSNVHQGIEIKVCTMKTMEFKAWMKSIERMSRNQRDKLRKRLEGKAHADEVIAMIEGGQDDKPACVNQHPKFTRYQHPKVAS